MLVEKINCNFFVTCEIRLKLDITNWQKNRWLLAKQDLEWYMWKKFTMLHVKANVMPENWYRFIFLTKKNPVSPQPQSSKYNLSFLSLLYRFNYRSTHHLVSHGFYNFLNWFDERAWYPLGRIVGGTVSHIYLLLSLSLF